MNPTIMRKRIVPYLNRETSCSPSRRYGNSTVNKYIAANTSTIANVTLISPNALRLNKLLVEIG